MHIKFGSLVTGGNGSIGGHTVQHSNYGYQLRTKPVNKRKPSLAQSLIRSFNPAIHGGWRALTDADRRIWISAAPYPLSGSQFYYQCQYTRLAEGLPFLKHPANKLDTYLGPELIDQELWNAPGLAWWSFISGDVSGNGSSITFQSGYAFLRKYFILGVGNDYAIIISLPVIADEILIISAGSANVTLSLPVYMAMLFLVSSASTNLRLQTYSSYLNINYLSVRQVFNYAG